MEEQNSVDEIRKLLTGKNLLIGERSVVKHLQAGKIKKVFAAKNCKASLRKDLERAKDIQNIPIVFLELNNEDLGVICKKPYSVSVIGVI